MPLITPGAHGLQITLTYAWPNKDWFPCRYVNQKILKGRIYLIPHTFESNNLLAVYFYFLLMDMHTDKDIEGKALLYPCCALWVGSNYACEIDRMGKVLGYWKADKMMWSFDRSQRSPEQLNDCVGKESQMNSSPCMTLKTEVSEPRGQRQTHLQKLHYRQP